MSDLWNHFAGELIKSAWRSAEHKKNELTLGKEEAARIKKEKYEKRHAKNKRDANIFGFLTGVMGFCMYISISDAHGNKA